MTPGQWRGGWSVIRLTSLPSTSLTDEDSPGGSKMKEDAERFTIKRLLTGAALIALTCFCGCDKPEPPAAISSTPAPAPAASAPTRPAAQAEPVNPIKLPPPNLSQVEDALKVVYQDSVVLAE